MIVRPGPALPNAHTGFDLLSMSGYPTDFVQPDFVKMASSGVGFNWVETIVQNENNLH